MSQKLKLSLGEMSDLLKTHNFLVQSLNFFFDSLAYFSETYLNTSVPLYSCCATSSFRCAFYCTVQYTLT